jgi:Zn-dependent protease with chaperone function
MTATRIVRGATIAAVVAAWSVVAVLLWRTKVPDGLRVPKLDEDAVFGRQLVRDAARYERVLDVLWLGATLTALAVLVLLARRGRRLARGLGLGRVNAGIVVGVVSLTILWAAGLPWAVATRWWQRRHGISYAGYLETLVGAWQSLLATTLVAFVALAVILGLAKALGARWWLAAAPSLLVLVAAATFLLPYLETLGTEPVRNPALRAAIQRLETREHAGNPPVRVQRVSSRTRTANAFAIGVGPSERVILWDTLVRKFGLREVRFAAAHELAHLARNHALKGLAWFALLVLPVLAVVALVTERRGGLRDPANVPLGLLVLVATTLALLPLVNAISRRYEAEADWVALGATRDPGAARGLFKGFTAKSLQDPTPPGWVRLFLEDHPTALRRIEQARAWAVWNR